MGRFREAGVSGPRGEEGLGAISWHLQLFVRQAPQSRDAICAQGGQGSYESHGLFMHVWQEQGDNWQQHLFKKQTILCYFIST